MRSPVAEWWLAVIGELGKIPRGKYPDLSIEEAGRLRLAEAMDAAKAKGAVLPEDQWANI